MTSQFSTCHRPAGAPPNALVAEVPEPCKQEPTATITCDCGCPPALGSPPWLLGRAARTGCSRPLPLGWSWRRPSIPPRACCRCLRRSLAHGAAGAVCPLVVVEHSAPSLSAASSELWMRPHTCGAEGMPRRRLVELLSLALGGDSGFLRAFFCFDVEAQAVQAAVGQYRGRVRWTRTRRHERKSALAHTQRSATLQLHMRAHALHMYILRSLAAPFVVVVAAACSLVEF